MFVGMSREVCLWEDLSDFLDFLSNRCSIWKDESRSGGPTVPNPVVRRRRAYY